MPARTGKDEKGGYEFLADNGYQGHFYAGGGYTLKIFKNRCKVFPITTDI